MRLPLSLAAVVLLLSTCSSPFATTDGVTAARTGPAPTEAASASTERPDRGGAPSRDEPAPVEPAPDEPAPDGDVAPPADSVLVLPAAGPPAPPDSPSAAAALITAAERAIRDHARSPEELEAAGHLQQVAYRKLVEHPDWVDAALAEIPEDLHGAARGNILAGARLLAMHVPANPNRPVRILDLPRWRIVAPPPADELLGYYQEAAAATGVHWTYLAAINLVETRMGRIIGVSSAGAQGPMQFMPATWAEWGQGDVTDHRDAIHAAARYLRWGGMPHDVNGALFRYNRDTRYVDAVRIYAEQMQGDPRAYYGYYHWQVYYDTRADNVWLHHGWDGTAS